MGVIASLAYAIMAAGLLLAVWTGVSAGRHQPTGELQMVSVLLLEAALLVQSILSWVRVGASSVDEPVTFIAYSIGVLAPLGLAFYLARIERTRWGSVIVCFAAVVITVMTLRLASLWGLL